MNKIKILAALILGTAILFVGCVSKPSEPEEEKKTPEIEQEEKKVEDKTDKDKTGKKEKEPEPEPEPEPVQIDPPDVAFVKNIQSELQSGSVANAIELFENIPEELKDDEEMNMLLASLYISNGDYDKAKGATVTPFASSAAASSSAACFVWP